VGSRSVCRRCQSSDQRIACHLEAVDMDITDRVWKLVFLVTALTAFFTVRERNNPSFMGFDLTQDESWAFLHDTLTEIATSYLKD
jgi:hypothetical protein